MENQPARQRMIKDLKKDDFRVQITGYIDAIEENISFLLQDGTGKIKVSIEKVEFVFAKNDLINVIGDIKYQEGYGLEIEADIIQDMKNLNFEYYKKLYEIKKEYI